MSLSPLVSFKSRFVTYLLNFPRTKDNDVQLPSVVTRYELFTVVFRTCILKF